MDEATKCTCGRPKWTPPDLKRWQDEIDEFGRAGEDARQFNPEWAIPIFWYCGPDKCPMKSVAP